MKNILIIILIFILRLPTFGQSTTTFDIEVVLIEDTSQTKKIKDFIRHDTIFYQDEKYSVRKTCRGEWGGTVWFKSKISGIEYSCEATCPVIINKIDEKYIVTNYSAHGCGGSDIIEIEFPDSMDIFKQPEPRIEKRRRKIINYGNYSHEFESKSRKGTKLVIDTNCVMILLSFPFQEQLYHIVRDSKILYLSQIKNNKLSTIDTIYCGLDNFYKRGEGILYSYNTEGFKTKDNHHIVLFNNSGLVGFLDIFENKIKLTRYQ